LEAVLQMALNYRIESIEGMPADVAREYKEIEDNGKKVFVLDLEGAYVSDEPVDALKRAKDHEKSARQSVEKKLKDIELARERLQEEINEMRKGNIPKGDVEALERSWKEKNEKLVTEYTAQISARDKTLQSLLVDSVATRMAGEISISPDLILPHVKSRLTTELVDGQFVTRVLDKEGKPSALSIDELQKDITADKRFAPIIKGSKASGGGASGASSGSSASPPVPVDKKFDWNKSSPAQIAAQLKARKAAEDATRTGG
jgi:hypothetical protein